MLSLCCFTLIWIFIVNIWIYNTLWKYILILDAINQLLKKVIYFFNRLAALIKISVNSLVYLFSRWFLQRYQGHNSWNFVAADHQSGSWSERSQLQAAGYQELSGEGCNRQTAHQPPDHLSPAGRVQSAAWCQPAGVCQGLLPEDQRPDACGLSGLAHPLCSGAPQSHQQQNSQPWCRKERGPRERWQQERKEGREG